MQELKTSNREKLKEHMYMVYLGIGIVAFALGAYISYRRIKNGN